MEESAPKQSTLQSIPEDPTPKNKYTDDLIDHYWVSINYISKLIKAFGLLIIFISTLYYFILSLL